MEIRRRHKIRKCLISRKAEAFGLLTNGGTAWFSPNSKSFRRRLIWHLPHLEEELLELGPHTVEEFEKLLVGRYVYGISKDQVYKDTFCKVLV